MRTRSVEYRLQALGLGTQLPAHGERFGFSSATRLGELILTSGHIDFDGALPSVRGRVGDTVPIHEAQTAAVRATALAIVAASSVLREDEELGGVLKLTVFIASAPGFSEQSIVANPASRLLTDLFGAESAHARSAIGVSELPFGAAVEVELVAHANSR